MIYYFALLLSLLRPSAHSREPRDPGFPAALDGRSSVFEWRSGRYGYQGWTAPETRLAAQARAYRVAVAIGRVTADPPMGWHGPRMALGRALVTIVHHESRLWRGVHTGEIRGMAGEWCLVQIHPAIGGWEGLAGTDQAATDRCLRAGGEIFARAWALCGPDFARAISAYGSGKGCDESGEWIDQRVATYEGLQRVKVTDRVRFWTEIHERIDNNNEPTH